MRPPSAQLWAMACRFSMLSASLLNNAWAADGATLAFPWKSVGNMECRQRGLSKEDHLVLQELKAAGNKGAANAEHAWT